MMVYHQVHGYFRNINKVPLTFSEPSQLERQHEDILVLFGLFSFQFLPTHLFEIYIVNMFPFLYHFANICIIPIHMMLY